CAQDCTGEGIEYDEQRSYEDRVLVENPVSAQTRFAAKFKKPIASCQLPSASLIWCALSAEIKPTYDHAFQSDGSVRPGAHGGCRLRTKNEEHGCEHSGAGRANQGYGRRLTCSGKNPSFDHADSSEARASDPGLSEMDSRRARTNRPDHRRDRNAVLCQGTEAHLAAQSRQHVCLRREP